MAGTNTTNVEHLHNLWLSLTATREQAVQLLDAFNRYLSKLQPYHTAQLVRLDVKSDTGWMIIGNDYVLAEYKLFEEALNTSVTNIRQALARGEKPELAPENKGD